MTDKQLIDLAIKAMDNAYTPYSGFKVGVALLSKSGKVFTGCNIENGSFSPTVCAERTAFYKAISEGENTFAKIAVVGGQDGKITDFRGTFEEYRAVQARKVQAAPVQKTVPEPKKEKPKNTKGTRRTRKIKRKEENRFSLQDNYKMKVLELIMLKM